ncbi:hypothetical protein IW261DRAFT_1429441 [Armillaria novae-zelandiae]|uniref:Uncharacterized protein n=1 Tax=Armillaria novae-zelandiae TaxID=153914 RepID=A0AA39KH33_9AGAR|nr:hypothetical protein IW261DRAFT_1429441 [Armillaria novae-zelandiae]
MPKEFAAGLDLLRPLLNPEKHGEFCPKDIATVLGASSPFLHATLSENTPVPKVFTAKLLMTQGQKRHAFILEEEGRPADAGHSMNTSAEDSDEESESEDTPPLKLTGGKGKAIAKLAVCSSASTMTTKSSLAKGLRSLGLDIVLPSGPPQKAVKTRPGPVKEELVPAINILCKTPATKPSHVGAVTPSISSSHLMEHPSFQPMLTRRKSPFLSRLKNLTLLLKLWPCLRMDVCNALPASKTSPVFSWAVVNNVITAKQLLKAFALSVQSPFNVILPINNSQNVLRPPPRQFQACFEELSQFCCHASSSKGQDTLLGVVFADRDFEDRVHAAIHRFNQQVSFPLDSTPASSILISTSHSSILLVECEPSLPLDPGLSSPPAFMAIIQASSPLDSLVNGDEVQGELNELESLPIHPAKGESSTAA